MTSVAWVWSIFAAIKSRDSSPAAADKQSCSGASLHGPTTSGSAKQTIYCSTHADRQGADISFTVCLFVSLFVRLQISPPRIKLAASNFALRFIVVQCRVSPIFVNFAPPKPKIVRMGPLAGHAHMDVNITVKMHRRKRQARDAPFVKSRGVWT